MSNSESAKSAYLRYYYDNRDKILAARKQRRKAAAALKKKTTDQIEYELQARLERKRQVRRQWEEKNRAMVVFMAI